MGNKYRITLILNNSKQSESAEDIMERISGYIVTFGGTILSKKNCGMRDFERCTKRDFRSGVYAQYEVTAGGKFNETLSNRLRLDRTVNRVLVERI
jgi:ribosomal protein S6